MKNVLVTGHGRSGTNWLLGMFDHSERSFCRNEPNEIADSPLARIHGAWVRGAADSALEKYWDDAVAWTCRRQGERDPDLPTGKFYLHGWCRFKDRIAIARRKRLRSRLGLVGLQIAKSEWELPFWLGRQGSLAEVLPVLKLVMVPGWIHWVLINRPETFVVHIARHPGGFMNSWLNRYVAKHDPQEVLQANRDRLHQVAAVESRWAKMFGNIDAMGLEESEIWYWAYATDVIHEAGFGKNNYQLIVYNSLAGREIETARSLYETVGLPWTARVEQQFKTNSMMKTQKTDAWRNHATPTQCELIERILTESGLDRFWR